MKDHLAIMAGLGAATLVMAWLPSISKKIKVSYSILLLLIGAILFYVNLPLHWPDPFWPDSWLCYISEVIVIISLMGTGLKIGRSYSLGNWTLPLRLILITMPLSMLAAYFLGVYFLSLTVPAALLIAAALAPTDPVLAADVQIENVENDKKDNSPVAFTLTGEAGINDGLAFPFTFLAILVAEGSFNFTEWFLDKFLLKIAIGVFAGFLIGRFLGYLIDRLPKIEGIKKPHGFISLSITFMTYGLVELIHGYGFLAVFVAALSIRYQEEVEGDIKVKMHDFVEEIERFLLVVWIILFGGSILNGILTVSGWKGIGFAVLFLFVVRPLAGWIGMIGTDRPRLEKFAISFFGIKGIGSIFYLSWAFLETNAFENKYEIYSVASWVIFISILLHGLTAPRIMAKLNK